MPSIASTSHSIFWGRNGWAVLTAAQDQNPSKEEEKKNVSWSEFTFLLGVCTTMYLFASGLFTSDDVGKAKDTCVSEAVAPL